MVNRVLAIALAALVPICAQAQSPGPSAEEMARQMDQIRASAGDIVGEETMSALKSSADRGQQQYAEQIEQIRGYNDAIAQQGGQIAQDMAGAQWDAALNAGQLPASERGGAGANDIPVRYRIFVSQRMPAAEIKNLVAMYRERPEVAIVLRGMLPGQDINGVHQWIAKMLKPINEGMSLPTMTMDPEPFNQLGVDQVPVIARYDDQGGLQAFALGMTSSAWIDERVSAGGKGNLGAFGPTIRVGEEDMIQAIMRRAEQFDWKGAAAGAIDRYWAKTSAYDMPRVTAARRLILDPTFEITQDITVPDGTVIARRGDRVNPLEVAPFNQTLLFFDPSDAEQVQWVKAQVAARNGQQVVVMASQLRSMQGLEALGEMSDSIGARIFQLPSEVRERFNVERVPTLVRAEGMHFVIEEQLPSNRPKDS